MKTENKKTLRGTVLFTVVAVMALLIIFLTSTLALASATGNRAHKSYASAQASYTARAAIDSFAQSMTRNEEIAAIVQNLGNNPTADAIHPKVEIGDLSLGQIGYYNASGTWIPDRIEIAPLENSTSYAFYDTDGDGTNEWGKVEGVRVTVTCRVGKEEETVSAYIRKSAVTASSNAGNGEVKGLQEAGGNTFRNGANVYGGLGVGLADSVPTNFHYHNKCDINTSLNFFNANVNGETSTFAVHVRKPTDSMAPMPYSETVVTGSFMTPNDEFIFLDYQVGAGETFDVKNTSYFYCNEALVAPKTSQSTLKLVSAGEVGTKQANGAPLPYNVFVGTMYLPKSALQTQADLYLMDNYNPSKKYMALFYDRDDAVKEDESYFTKVGASYEGSIVSGDNVIGRKDGGQNALYTWTGSVVNKNEQASGNSSTGGNIYCNGNLTLYRTHVNGDVRVMGDFYVGDSVTIDGDLVVKGQIHKLEGQNPTVGGIIYNGTSGGGGINPGYTYHDNELLPGYTEVLNIKFENNEVPNVIEDTDSEGNTIYTILDGEGGGDVYPSKPYYRINVDGTEDISEITTKQFSTYESKKDGENVVPVLDADGKGILTDDDMTYYDEFGVKVGKDDAFDSYYTNAAGQKVPDSEAIAAIVAGQNPSYAAYVAQKHQEAYPQSMTREKIYGEVKEVNGEMKFVPADEKTKIITTLKEAREALNMNPTTGEYNTSVYLSAVPGGDPPEWDGSDTITSSCTIKNTTIDKNITVDTASEIWIVLDNCTLGDGKTITVQEDATGKHGTVNFLIRGTVKLGNKAKIITSAISDGCTVSYTKDFGIIYYADASSNPVLDLAAGSNPMVCGSIKAPDLTVLARLEGGAGLTINYISEYSATPKQVKPNILGNALVKRVERQAGQDMNDFAVIYTKSGTGGSVSGGGGGLVPTSLGYFDIGYLAGA